MIFLTLTPMNKSVKFGLKKLFFFFLKKKTDMYCISDSHFIVKIYELNIQKSQLKNAKDP